MSGDTSSSTEKRPQFGNRFLTEDQDVFSHNAWDQVEWNEEQERDAKKTVAANSEQKMSSLEREKFQNEADQFWDSFYNIHQNRFFKDRHWLTTEFPELITPSKVMSKQTVCRNIFELGCGVGNTILPLLTNTINQNVKIYGCDFSSRAIEILRSHPKFDTRRCKVFVMDATVDNWQVPFEPNSLDIIVLIFVLSAIEPVKMAQVAKNCFRYLRPGGLVLFRDYGRYDLAQLRFKTGKCLEDNFYVRGDGTMVYFFVQDEIRQLFCNAGFAEKSNTIDRRLQVNRGRMLKMYRVWIQAKYIKPAE